MIFKECSLNGLFFISLDPIEDNRGFFARSFCKKELLNHGIDFDVKQCNYSYNKTKGTLRGMHYQNPPYLEDKIVTCIKGKVYDVIVDFRVGSPTYLKWEGFELSGDTLNALYIPKGFAHGFVTLEDDTILSYQMSEYYVGGQERGLRYDDPKIGIKWPIMRDYIMSEKDQKFELL